MITQEIIKFFNYAVKKIINLVKIHMNVVFLLELNYILE